MREYPSRKQILRKIAAEKAAALAAEDSGASVVVVEGFDWIHVGGWPVGRRLSADEAFGAGGSRVVGFYFVEEDLGSRWTVFIRDEYAARHEDYLQRRRGVPFPKASPEKELEDLAADCLRAQGGNIEQQVRCAAGIVDIADHSARRIIECKASSSRSAVFQAIVQLEGYTSCFPGYSGAVCLPDLPDPSVQKALAAVGIDLLTEADFQPVFDNTKAGRRDVA